MVQDRSPGLISSLLCELTCRHLLPKNWSMEHPCWFYRNGSNVKPAIKGLKIAQFHLPCPESARKKIKQKTK